MKITFYLARPESKTATAIYAAIRYGQERLNYGVGISLLPSQWSKQHQRARELRSFPNFSAINKDINRFEHIVEVIFSRYTSTHGRCPGTKQLKSLLDDHFTKTAGDSFTVSFFDYFRQLVKNSAEGTRLNPLTSKPIHAGTIKTYRTALDHLLEFQQHTKYRVDFDTIHLDFHKNYYRYFAIDRRKYSDSPLLRVNSVGKDIQILKLVLNEATADGINKNQGYKDKRFIVHREKTDTIHLNEQEIEALYQLDLSGNKHFEITRDLFVLGFKTGLRYSDFSHIRPEQINDTVIHIGQQKLNDAPVTVPIHPITKAIILKYGGHLPKAFSNQKTNEYLKQIARMLSSLQAEVCFSYTIGGKRVTEYLPKWQRVTTHTARRSFATNEAKAQTPVAAIMAITGHKTEKAFWRYVKLSKTDYADLLNEIWAERLAHKNELMTVGI